MSLHQRVSVMGMPIDCLTERDAVGAVVSEAAAGKGGWVITPNLHLLREFHRSEEVRSFFKEADLVLADGMPIVWASQLQRTPLPERVAGSNMVHSLSEEAAKRGLSVFLLGGNPGVAEQASNRLGHTHPGLKVVGSHCPNFGFENEPGELVRIVEAVKEAQPDIVYVALSFPKGERLTKILREVLPNSWFLGIGISLSFVTEEVKRAPKWVQNTGFEWLYRLLQEPRRLAKRYLIHGVPFSLLLLKSALIARHRVKPVPLNHDRNER